MNESVYLYKFNSEINVCNIYLYTWSQIIHRSVDNDIAILLKKNGQM